LRLACALGAIGIVLLLAVMRIHSLQTGLKKQRTASVYGQIARIRTERKSRFQRKIR